MTEQEAIKYIEHNAFIDDEVKDMCIDALNRPLNGLSKSQCKNLADFIEYNFIDSLRNDTDIDNIDYVVDMSKAYEVLRKAGDKDAEH